MDINLLPHVPTTKKYQWPIVIFAGVLVFLFSFFVGLQLWNQSSTLSEDQAVLELKKSELGTKMEILNKEQEIKLQIEKYLTDYQELLPTHVNWVPYVDQISHQLPTDGRIIRMAWSDEGVIEIDGVFSSISGIGQYVQLLNQLVWIEDIEVTRIEESTNSVQFTIKILVNLEQLYVDKEVPNS